MKAPREYALVIVKPDGVRDDKAEEVLDFFQNNNITLVKSVSKKVTKAILDDIFTSKHNGAFYKKYMTSGKMIAYLMEGNNGFEQCRLLKNKLREQYGVDKVIENICHTPESGNEYIQQLRFFFPECCDGKYQLYSDVYCKVYASSDYEHMKNCLNFYREKTNSRLIFVFGNEEMHMYGENIAKFYLEDEAERNFVGVEYIVASGKDKLKIVGYYNTKIISSLRCENVYIYRNVHEVLDLIAKNNGIPVWGYNKKVENIMEYFEKYPLSGAIVYHPLYSIKETELLRESVVEHGMLSLGGSGGAHPGECSISYSLFGKFENYFLQSRQICRRKMDCHIHTKYSDGLSDAEDIVGKCGELEFDCFAITDHDTICELKKFEGTAVRNLIFGTEITTICLGTEIHVLAYFSKVPADDFEAFLKNNRIKNSILLHRCQKNRESNVNTVKNVAKMIRQYGGISIIAHPYSYWDLIDEIIDDCDGMELIYPSFGKKDIEKIIDKYGNRCRFFTAGSDFHGDHFTGNDYIIKYCQVYGNYLMPFLNYFKINEYAKRKGRPAMKSQQGHDA